jgi:hypothetical protein
MVLALMPLGATFSSDRLLVFVGLGAMALLARLFDAWIVDVTSSEGRPDARAVLTAGLVLVHLVEAPIALPGRAAQMEIFAAAHDYAAAGIPSDPGVATKTVVVVAAPTVMFANYIQAEREVAGVPRPERLYVLAGASSKIRVVRSATNSLTLTPEQGFVYTPLEQHYRGATSMRAGGRVVLGAMTATVESQTSDARPATVKFSFEGPPARYVFVKWDGGRYVPFELPAVGQAVTLPEEDFGKILVESMLRAI